MSSSQCRHTPKVPSSMRRERGPHVAEQVAIRGPDCGWRVRAPLRAALRPGRPGLFSMAIPSRFRTNATSSACFASRIFLNLFNSFFVMFCLLSLLLLFFRSFFVFVCPRHILRRWSKQKGSDLHTRFDDGFAFLIANSSMREGFAQDGWPNGQRARTLLGRAYAPSSPPDLRPVLPRSKSASHSIAYCCRFLQAIKVPILSSLPAAHSTWRIYRTLIGLQRRKHYVHPKFLDVPRCFILSEESVKILISFHRREESRLATPLGLACSLTILAGCVLIPYAGIQMDEALFARPYYQPVQENFASACSITTFP